MKMLFIRTGPRRSTDSLLEDSGRCGEGGEQFLLAHVKILSTKIRGKAKYCISYLYATERTHLPSICFAIICIYLYVYSMVELSAIKMQTLHT